jgi:hypothetical protein
VEPDDPLFALVTINKMVLEEATQELQNRIHVLISGFDASYQRAEKRAGSVLAQIVKESAEQMRQGLQNDIQRAGLKACEFVHLVNEAHRRPALIRWSAVGLAAGALLFGGGVWLGLCCISGTTVWDLSHSLNGLMAARIRSAIPPAMHHEQLERIRSSDPCGCRRVAWSPCAPYARKVIAAWGKWR